MDCARRKSIQENYDILMYQDYKFSKMKRELAADEIKWPCCIKACKTSLEKQKPLTEKKSIQNRLNHEVHNCVVDCKLHQKIKLVRKKRKATVDVCERPSKVLNTSLATTKDSNNIKVSGVKLIKTNTITRSCSSKVCYMCLYLIFIEKSSFEQLQTRLRYGCWHAHMICML
jgi:hypothetical protein